MNQKIIDDLLKLEEKVEEAKTKESQSGGTLIELYKQLNRELGVDDEEEAEKKLVKIEKEKEKLEIEIEKNYKIMKEKYEW